MLDPRLQHYFAKNLEMQALQSKQPQARWPASWLHDGQAESSSASTVSVGASNLSAVPRTKSEVISCDKCWESLTLASLALIQSSHVPSSVALETQLPQSVAVVEVLVILKSTVGRKLWCRLMIHWFWLQSLLPAH